MNMENNAGGKNEALSPQEESAKAAILAECDTLAKAGVTFVAVHFDGYGEDGATEEVKCFNISNDVGPVKELLLLDLAVSGTPFPSAQTHWLLSAWLGPVFFIIVVA